MKKVAGAIMFVFLLAASATLGSMLIPKITDVDAGTKELCWEYAHRSHEKEINPVRWKINGTWPEFNWYRSCIDHELYPVAR